MKDILTLLNRNATWKEVWFSFGIVCGFIAGVVISVSLFTLSLHK